LNVLILQEHKTKAEHVDQTNVKVVKRLLYLDSVLIAQIIQDPQMIKKLVDLIFVPCFNMSL